MRKLLMLAIAVLILGMPRTFLRAQGDVLKAEKHNLKARQKQERAALELRKKNWEQSIKGQPLPKSERLRMKHQLEREQRQLRERQKDERQDNKDRQRSLREMQKHL